MKLLLTVSFFVISIFTLSQQTEPAEIGKSAKFRQFDIGTNLLSIAGLKNQKHVIELRKTSIGESWWKVGFSYQTIFEDPTSQITHSTDSSVELKSWQAKTAKYQLRTGIDWHPDKKLNGLTIGLGLICGYVPEQFQYKYSKQVKQINGSWGPHWYNCSNGCTQFDPDRGGKWTQRFFNMGMEVSAAAAFHLSRRLLAQLRAVCDVTYNWYAGSKIESDSDNWFAPKENTYLWNDFGFQLMVRYKV